VPPLVPPSATISPVLTELIEVAQGLDPTAQAELLKLALGMVGFAFKRGKVAANVLSQSRRATSDPEAS
jgi:hypothetical protein